MSEKLLLPLMIVACASGCLALDRLDWQPLLDQQNVIIRQMMHTLPQTRSVRGEPVDINSCFDWYKVELDGISKLYEQEFSGCKNATATAKQLLSEQNSKERSDLVSRGQSICIALDDCDKIDDLLQFFNCYNTVSSSNTQNLYGISADSERDANNLTIQYQRIADDEIFCTAAARNDYSNSLSTCASKLNNCLIGQWSPPEVTGAPTTKSPAQTEPAPSQTTEAAPQTTEAAAPLTTEVTPQTTEAAPQTTEAAAPLTTEAAPQTTEAAPQTTEEAAPLTTEAALQTTEAAPPLTTEVVPPQTTDDTEFPETTVVEPIDGTTTESEVDSNESRLPEEDLYRYRPMTRMNMWNIMRRV